AHAAAPPLSDHHYLWNWLGFIKLPEGIVLHIGRISPPCSVCCRSRALSVGSSRKGCSNVCDLNPKSIRTSREQIRGLFAYLLFSSEEWIDSVSARVNLFQTLFSD